MYEPLRSCPSCARHVRAIETQCPFCAAALPETTPSGVASFVPRGVSRAAALTLGASLVVGGCGKTTRGPDDNGGVAAAYGAAPADAAFPAPTVADPGVAVPRNGAAPNDAGRLQCTERFTTCGCHYECVAGEPPGTACAEACSPNIAYPHVKCGWVDGKCRVVR